MRVSLIGAGNVGYHLAQRLRAKGVTLCQIFSRDAKKVNSLAEELGTEAVSDLQALSDEADLYILAVKDDAIVKVAGQLGYLNKGKRIFAHTSGATSSTVLAPYFHNYGIFYPLQTFSRTIPIDFDQLPLCIYGNDVVSNQQLTQLAKTICPNVYHLDDKQRRVLHVGAVMVNNFTNHLFAVTSEICKKEKLPFELLKPLIQETVNKLAYLDPKAAQTGPAARGDQGTINTHLNYLDSFPAYQELYRLLSASISQMKDIG